MRWRISQGRQLSDTVVDILQRSWCTYVTHRGDWVLYIAAFVGRRRRQYRTPEAER